MEVNYKRSVLALFILYIFLLSCAITVSLLNNFALHSDMIDSFTLSRIKTLTWPMHLVSSIVVAILAFYTLLSIRKHSIGVVTLFAAVAIGVGEIFAQGSTVTHIAHYIFSFIGVAIAFAILFREVVR